MSLTRLASGLQLPKSSVHALCGTLLAHGYLRRQIDGSFFIGPRVMPLADAFVAGTEVATEFLALWGEADPPPHETTVLSLLDGRDVVYLAAHQGTEPLGLAFRVGMRLPANLTASGKALLAGLPADAVRRLFENGLPAPLGRHRPAQRREEFEAELARVRADGCSIDAEGVRAGVHGFGAPVFDASGHAVAGVSVCVQRSAIDATARRQYCASVMRIADRLTRRLGGRVPPAADPSPAQPTPSSHAA